jgi:hypothetical protein
MTVYYLMHSKIWEASRKPMASGPAGSLLREMLDSALLAKRGTPNDLQEMLSVLARIILSAANHSLRPTLCTSGDIALTQLVYSSDGPTVLVLNDSLTSSRKQGKNMVI